MQRKRVFCVTVFTNNVLKKRKDMNTEFPHGSSHLVTQEFLSGRPGSFPSSSASRLPRWPAGQGSGQSDLDTEQSRSAVCQLTIPSCFIIACMSSFITKTSSVFMSSRTDELKRHQT